MSPRRILVAHHLLLGDTLMLTPLLAKLRERYPEAEVTITVPRACAPLYAERPYGVRALGWDPRNFASVRKLLRELDFDLALIPGDNRHSWLAQAMGARWIIAFDGDRPPYKNWPVDELRAYPQTPAAWFDMTAELVDGMAPMPFAAAAWRVPAPAPFALPLAPYCVLHVGASSRLKLWEPDRWHALAAELRARGQHIAWSAGPGEEALVDACAPLTGDVISAGRLDLAQLWHLLRAAQLLVAPDTGVAHLGRIAGTPTIALFGPGSAQLAGPGVFWRNSSYRALTITPFPCRDQHVLFKRELAWIQVCKRTPAECPAPRCMQAISVGAVIAACEELLRPGTIVAPDKPVTSR
ncbi:MAG: glycosyltransferase family 9 protein [Betaproteobacteria bacterium]